LDVLRHEKIVQKRSEDKNKHRALHQLLANVSLIVIIQTVKTPLLEMGFAGTSSQTLGLVIVSPISLSTFTLTDEMYVWFLQASI